VLFNIDTFKSTLSLNRALQSKRAMKENEFNHPAISICRSWAWWSID